MDWCSGKETFSTSPLLETGEKVENRDWDRAVDAIDEYISLKQFLSFALAKLKNLKSVRKDLKWRNGLKKKQEKIKGRRKRGWVGWESVEDWMEPKWGWATKADSWNLVVKRCSLSRWSLPTGF